MTENKQYWFESVPEEKRYWFLVQMGTPLSQADEPEPDVTDSILSETSKDDIDELIRRQDAVGFAPSAVQPELVETNPDKYSLFLYTTRAAAQEVLRDIEERDPDEYLRLVEVYGQERVDKAYSNTAPVRVVWTTDELLLETIKNLELGALEGYEPPFEHVVVDGQRLERWPFTQELEQRVQKEGDS